MSIETKLIAFFSPKGGSGKTTLATQIAVTAKHFGHSVVFYDLDPQKTASFYLTRLHQTLQPDALFHDFNTAPPQADFIILDCEPSMRFVPPKDFLIVAPTLASPLDLHSYRKILELEKEGYKIIKVVNQYSSVRNDDKAVKESLDPCVIITQNSAIRQAMGANKTIWNFSHSSMKRARNQFKYLIQRIMKGSAETLTEEDITYIMLKGAKKNELKD